MFHSAYHPGLLLLPYASNVFPARILYAQPQNAMTSRSHFPLHQNSTFCRIRLFALLLTVFVVPPVPAQMFALPAPGNDIIGTVTYTEATEADTLLDIARRYDLGYEEIRFANPTVDTWLPGDGTRVILPTRYILPNVPREGIVVNVAEMRLYYFPKPKPGYVPMVETFPISIGRSDWNTPVATTRVTAKITDPAWYPPESIRAEHASDGDPLPTRVAPGDDNPLGRFALRLSLSSYLIHGTNKDFGIGMQVTHGCIRLYPEDISGLFYNVPVGTPVRIINQPYKAGWENGALYLEIHPLLEGTPEEERQNRTPLVQSLIEATANRAQYPINWHAVQTVEQKQNGLPTPVGPALTTAGPDTTR